MAEKCIEHGVKRLIHVGSIAGLYLGDKSEIITGTTPPDPQADQRADYARAKAEADHALLDLHKAEDLSVCIIRPGIVVGEGASPFHSGIGFANVETDWFGWGNGKNDLPFVLVDDVAEALTASLTAVDIEGKCFNLASNIGLGAQKYVDEVGRRLGRPVNFHPNSIYRVWLEEVMKWLVKVAIGRKAARPAIRDFRSRAMLAKLDCSDAKAALNWHPEEDVSAFLDRVVPEARHDDGQ